MRYGAAPNTNAAAWVETTQIERSTRYGGDLGLLFCGGRKEDELQHPREKRCAPMEKLLRRTESRGKGAAVGRPWRGCCSSCEGSLKKTAVALGRGIRPAALRMSRAGSGRRESRGAMGGSCCSPAARAPSTWRGGDGSLLQPWGRRSPYCRTPWKRGGRRGVGWSRPARGGRSREGARPWRPLPLRWRAAAVKQGGRNVLAERRREGGG
jgi:hypothetical protein